MAIVRAGPNEFLLVGRGGRLENRGSAIQSFLLPGTIWVLVPSAKHEATFEFTQETRDGIPLRFKGIVVYRVTEAGRDEVAHGIAPVRPRRPTPPATAVPPPWRRLASRATSQSVNLARGTVTTTKISAVAM